MRRGTVSALRDPRGALLKAAVVAPHLIIAALIWLVILAVLPGAVAWVVVVAGSVALALLAAGVAEGLAVRILCGGRRPTRDDECRLAVPLQLLAGRVDTAGVLLRVRTGGRPVDAVGRRHVVLTRQVVDAHGSGRLSLLASSAGDSPSVQGPIFGDPRMTVPRLGQQAFKSMVLAAYHRRCAITGGRITPVLQAAQIRPVAHHGEHRLDNGLLLRSDVHTLFDQGYLGIDDHHRIHVSRRLREDFGNGAEFYARAGAVIELPERRAERPAREAVTWHMDTVFLN